MNRREEAKTNIANPHYDLVSVLYHALEGAQVTDTYVKDAEHEGDQELAQFFRQVKQEDVKRADKAKELLGMRVSREQKKMQ
jgi:rubrerythrin